MNAENRKEVRKAFAALLPGALPSAQIVFDHLPSTFDHQSPAVCVGSGGSERERISMRGSVAAFQLDVHIFVLCAVDVEPDESEDAEPDEPGDASTSYTQADATDLLDDIEQQLASLVYDGQATAPTWICVGYAEKTAPDFVIVDGREYLRERISLAFQSRT